MSLKLTSREKLLAANAIGSIKLGLTSEDYPAITAMMVTAEKNLQQLRASLAGKVVDTLNPGPKKET